MDNSIHFVMTEFGVSRRQATELLLEGTTLESFDSNDELGADAVLREWHFAPWWDREEAEAA
jgi:hypothetical protein